MRSEMRIAKKERLESIRRRKNQGFGKKIMNFYKGKKKQWIEKQKNRRYSQSAKHLEREDPSNSEKTRKVSSPDQGSPGSQKRSSEKSESSDS